MLTCKHTNLVIVAFIMRKISVMYPEILEYIHQSSLSGAFYFLVFFYGTQSGNNLQHCVLILAVITDYLGRFELLGLPMAKLSTYKTNLIFNEMLLLPPPPHVGHSHLLKQRLWV